MSTLSSIGQSYEATGRDPGLVTWKRDPLMQLGLGATTRPSPPTMRSITPESCNHATRSGPGRAIPVCFEQRYTLLKVRRTERGQ
jgi:hypothetical protein